MDSVSHLCLLSFAELLNRLQSELGHPDRKDLFSRQMGPLLRKYAGSCHKWNAQVKKKNFLLA